MGSKPRGYFLMINNVEFTNNIEKTRKGSEVDEQNLKDLFEQLGFVVEPYRDQGLEVGIQSNDLTEYYNIVGEGNAELWRVRLD